MDPGSLVAPTNPGPQPTPDLAARTVPTDPVSQAALMPGQPL